MAKKLTSKLQVELGGVNLGKKDTNRVSCSAKFEDNNIDANGAQALLAAGQLHCRFDKATPNQGTLPLDKKALPPSVIEFDGTCHRIGMDKTTFSFGLSFPKAAQAADALAEFAGCNARLTVTRTGDADTVAEEDEGETDKGVTE